jgi:hypothetical protein
MAAAVMEAPQAPARCPIEEVFTTSFIELLAMAPRNPIVRSLVLALTRKMPPAESQSYEEVKDWVETNCKKRLPKCSPGSSEGIHISVDFSRKEYGRASYSVDRSGTEDFHLDAGELLEIVRDVLDSGQRLEELVSRVVTTIDESAWDRCDPELDDYGDYDYSDHDQDDSEHSKVEFSKAQVRQRVVAFLQEHHPELLEALT